MQTTHPGIRTSPSAAPPSMPQHLQPGDCLYWRRHVYRIVSLDAEKPLEVNAISIPEEDPLTISLLDLFGHTAADDDGTLFVSKSIEALKRQIEQHYASSPKLEAVIAHNLPVGITVQARRIITVVEAVHRLVDEDERRARVRNEPYSRTQAVQRAVQVCSELRFHVEVGGQDREYSCAARVSTYYKYARIYNRAQGNEGRIAFTLHRCTFRQSQFGPAQRHFVDACLLFYYRPTRFTKRRVYRLAENILRTRTRGLWVDPERCNREVPSDLVKELLNVHIPMQAILANPEKRALLVPTALPSQAWFYSYTDVIQSSPDAGRELLSERLGSQLWEELYLVFDTFVKRAALPLEYVFSDHWLVNAWIVDDATRSRPLRLWLTLLIDAYSRSILGMALLHKAPSIESIQTALEHAIWPKTSHIACGVPGEWNAFGIPWQLFLDNAWAHLSQSLENVARAISQSGKFNSIDLVFRPPYRRRYGAIIERVFANFSGQMRELVEGAIRDNTAYAAKEAASHACLLYSDIYRLLHQLILKYQHTPHSGLQNRTPEQVWKQALATSGPPLIPQHTPAMARHFLHLFPGVRTFGSHGLAAFGLHYNGAMLGGLERQEHLDGHERTQLTHMRTMQSSIKYQFAYNMGNISRIAIYRDGTWVGDGVAQEFLQPDGSVYPVSWAAWEQAKQLVRDGYDVAQGRSASDLVQTTSLQELIELRRNEKAAMKKSQAPGRRPSTKSAHHDTPDAYHPEIGTTPDPDPETRKVLSFLYGTHEGP